MTDESESESDPFKDATVTDFLMVLFVLTLGGPFALVVAVRDRSAKAFVWGAGTSLLYVGIGGIVYTDSVPDVIALLGLGPYVDMAEAYAYAAADVAVTVGTMPETYFVALAVGLVTVSAFSVWLVRAWKREAAE